MQKGHLVAAVMVREYVHTSFKAKSMVEAKVELMKTSFDLTEGNSTQVSFWMNGDRLRCPGRYT